MSVLQNESPDEIVREATAKAVEQASKLPSQAYNKTELFRELRESVAGSSILRATSRFIVGKHIEKPFLNGITAKNLYEDVLDLVDESQVAYLDLVEALVAGGNEARAKKTFSEMVVFRPTEGGAKRVIAKLRMPSLSELEIKGVLQSQEAAFFRMASEIDERVLEQYRGTHG